MRKFLTLFAVLVLCSVLALAQTKTVTGRVTDQQGQAVPFASVRISGSKQGVSADGEGAFTIKVKVGDELLVSGTGITQKKVTVGSDNSIVIQVTRQTSNLTEVVVTSLGIQKQAKELGYSTAKVTGKDIVQAKPISVANGLTGKVAGLQINTVNNGVFAPTRITLRGNRSLTGNNQPLLVVDGAIYYNDISTLNPEDIQDVNLLKGSSASAIYGSDASNGVIIVTTKHGTRARPVVTFSVTAQNEQVSYLPEYQTRFGNNGGERYVYDYNDLSTYVPYENQSYGAQFNGAMVPSGRRLADGSLNMIPYSPVKNQKRDFFDKPWTMQYNFSYSAGDENSRFFMSAQDVSTKGVMPGDEGRRDAFRVGGSKTYGIFSANYSLSYTYKKTNLTNMGEVYQLVMNTPAEIPLSSLKDYTNNKYATLDGYYNDYFENPYWVAAHQRNNVTDNNLSGNMQLNLKPLKWLNLSYRLALNNLSRNYNYQQGEADYSNYTKTADTVWYSNSNGTGIVPFVEGPKWISLNSGYTLPEYNNGTYNNFLITSDFLASYDNDLSKDWHLKATIGTTYLDNQITSTYTNAGSIFFPVYNVNSLTGIAGLGNLNYFEEANKLGYFGEATVGFKNLAFLHGSYRTDIDSRLSEDNRYIPYWDIDASLIVSDLIPALGNSKVMDFVKVSGAYSVTGNASALAGGSPYIADGAYATVPTLGSAPGFPFNGLGGYLLNTTIANPNIKPETVTETELRLELGFMQGRMNFSATAYQQKLKDGIVYAQVPRSSGSYSALVNAANTDNKGLELEFKGTIVKSRDFNWNVGINYTHISSEVISINGGQTQLAINPSNNANSFAVVGQPYPVIMSRDWVRDPLNGKVIVDPTTGDPAIDPNLKVLGNAAPTDIVGITTSLTWKDFTLVATADYRGGYKIFNSVGQYMDFTGITTTTAASGRQRFVFPNSEYSTDGGKTYTANTNIIVDDANFNFFPGQYQRVGANYVVSAAAWKLREVAISYNIPRKVTAPTKVVQSAVITLSGRNLVMLRPKTNVWTDPEFNDGVGNDFGRTSTSQAPPTRIYSATLTLTF